MHGKTGTARQASAGGHARHVETTQRAAPPVHGDLRTDEPSAVVRISPFAVAQDNSWARQWPLQSSLELSAFPGAVPCARLHARQMLWEWRLTGLSDIAELLISELVTNAVQISRADGQTTPVRLWVLADRTRVLILVWDSSPLPPVRMRTSEDDENGRGLLLVETLSTRWDWYFPPQQNGGKVVWALMETQ
jgi:anti-sigma regulatory factor (Ser/Thr protein kinase)